MLNVLLALGLGYLVGSFPSAYLAARARGQSIFQVGSGNMGAMNTARNLGYGLGVGVLLFDVGKGALATYLGLLLSSDVTGLLPAFIAGVGAVLGHAYPVWLGFKGGKALATTLGTALPLFPVVGLLGLGLIIVLILVTKRTPLSSVITVMAYPVLLLLFMVWREQPTSQVVQAVGCALVVAAVVTYKHLPEFGE